MPDDFRGRAFALFDIAYNLGYIVPAIILFLVWTEDSEATTRSILLVSGAVFLGLTALVAAWARRIRDVRAPGRPGRGRREPRVPPAEVERGRLRGPSAPRRDVVRVRREVPPDLSEVERREDLLLRFALEQEAERGFDEGLGRAVADAEPLPVGRETVTSCSVEVPSASGSRTWKRDSTFSTSLRVISMWVRRWTRRASWAASYPRARWARVAMAEVRVADATLHVEVEGDGAPVTAFAHGLTNSCMELAAFTPFAPGTRVRFCFRGARTFRARAGTGRLPLRGLRPRPATPWAVATGATQVVGTSLGAGAVAHSARRGPGPVRTCGPAAPARLGGPSGRIPP